MALKSNYHHGNLRQALMDEALSCIRQQGADQLSLRALARKIGVSQAAPYRHFEDKLALLKALADDGFERLSASMREAMGDIESDPVGAFHRGGEAYVLFATQNPETYRLMYSVRADEAVHESEENSHSEAFLLLEKTVEAGLHSGAFKALDKDAIVMAAWSLVHGYAQLILDGIIDGKESCLDAQFQAIGMVMQQGVVAQADEHSRS